VLTNPEPGLVANWTQVTNLSFVSPIVLNTGTALNGNQTNNQQAFSAVLISGLVVPPGQNVFFRWRDFNDSGGDQGMALDDLTISFEVPADRFWTNSLGGHYEVAANWLSNIVPLPYDTAHFTSNATYQVNWGADALAANAFFDASGGTVTQALGAFVWTLTNSYVVGRDGTARAAVTHTSGTLRVTNSQNMARLVVGQSGRGTFNLTGGEIVTDTLLATNGASSVFIFTGGALRTRNTTFVSPAQFVVGDGASPATFELLSNGTNSFANGLNIQSQATLMGNGTVLGTLIVNASGRLSPGASIGKIVLSNPPFLGGTMIMEIDRNGATVTNDQLQVFGSLAYDGALAVTNIGTSALMAGDRFQLFSATSFAGSFTSLTFPPLPAGLNWTNKLLLDGT